MRFLRILPAVWPRISWSFSSLTRNIAFGSSSTTWPRISRSSSLAIHPRRGLVRWEAKKRRRNSGKGAGRKPSGRVVLGEELLDFLEQLDPVRLQRKLVGVARLLDVNEVDALLLPRRPEALHQVARLGDRNPLVLGAVDDHDRDRILLRMVGRRDVPEVGRCAADEGGAVAAEIVAVVFHHRRDVV